MRPPYSGVVDQRGAKGGNPIVLGRKFCSGCGRWRPVHDFPRMDRKVGGGLRARCWVCHRRYQSRLVAGLSPERAKLRREYHRIWFEGWRRRQGIPERNFHNRKTVIDRAERVLLDPAPLLEAIEERLDLERRSGWHPDDTNGMLGGLEGLAQIAGISSRSLTRLRSGESRHVRLDVADQIAVALEIPLTLLYPFG